MITTLAEQTPLLSLPERERRFVCSVWVIPTGLAGGRRFVGESP